MGQVDARCGVDGHLSGRELGRSQAIFGRPQGGIWSLQVQQGQQHAYTLKKSKTGVGVVDRND